MTYMDNENYRPTTPLVAGYARDAMNSVFRRIRSLGQTNPVLVDGIQVKGAERTPLEKALLDVQSAVSGFSMHLPAEFTGGLNRQFANMFDVDAWEDSDKIPEPETVKTFLRVLLWTNTNRRPGIGTDGLGSITAHWSAAGSRLTLECQESGWVSWVLSRSTADCIVERAAGNCRAERLMEVLAPYDPEVWFDQ